MPAVTEAAKGMFFSSEIISAAHQILAQISRHKFLGIHLRLEKDFAVAFGPVRRILIASCIVPVFHSHSIADRVGQIHPNYEIGWLHECNPGLCCVWRGLL